MSDEARLAIDTYLNGSGAGPSIAEIKKRIADFVARREGSQGPGRAAWSYYNDTSLFCIRDGVKIKREKVK